MNKIIIVGHDSSGLEDVELLLFQLGMKPALPSRREGLLPNEITASLCNAHQTPSLNPPIGKCDFRQIEPAPMWNTLALDLAMGNSGQGVWGWADSRTIFLLDYWRELDSQAAFVLVYDDPRHMLLEAGRRLPDEEEIQKLLVNWAAYNEAILHFFLRHPDRCVLVNAREACGSPAACLALLRTRFALPLQAAGPDLADDGIPPHESDNSIPSTAPQPPARASANTATPNTSAPAETGITDHVTVAEHYSIDCHLSEQPAHMQLFDELQAAASLPLEPTIEDPANTRGEWSALIAQPLVLARTFCRMHHQLRTLELKNKQCVAERDLLSMRLHQAQEELEHYFMEYQRLTRVPARMPLYGAAKRVKQQLSYRLGSTMVKRSRSLGGCLGLPFALLREVRAYNRDKKRPGLKKLPPIQKYKDFREAERIKQQLSYRLGNALVENARSPIGLIRLPFILVHETIGFKKTRRQARK